MQWILSLDPPPSSKEGRGAAEHAIHYFTKGESVGDIENVFSDSAIL